MAITSTILQAIADYYGVDPKKWIKTSGEHRKEKLNKQALEDRKDAERRFASPYRITQLVNKLYLREPNHQLSQYSVSVNDMRIDTSLYVCKETLDRSIAPEDITTDVKGDGSLDRAIIDSHAETMRDYAAKIIERLQKLQVDIWDQPLYRLNFFEFGAHPSVEFSESSFVTYRFTTGLLADELVDALVQSQGDIDAILVRQDYYLPIRSRIMRDSKSLLNLESRICAGGMGALIAFADRDRFLLPIQARSSKVSDGRGLRAVIPKAFHQPTVSPLEESRLEATLFREIFEELYGGNEAERGHDNISHDWFWPKKAGVNYFREHHGAYTTEVTSFGINAASGNYEFGMLLVVPDQWYWRTFGSELQKNWETSRIALIPSDNKEQLETLLTEDIWASEGLVHFVEGLLRLKSVAGRRMKVELPKIVRQLTPA